MPEIEAAIPRDEVLDALQRVLRSSAFVQSNRLSRFLRFTVESTLDGKNGPLKEYTIGTEVYERKAGYDPSDDSIVRTEARRMRSKLKDYYETQGKDDPIVIYFRPGSYVPAVRWRASFMGQPQTETLHKGEDLFSPGDGIRVAVEPFAAQPGDAVASACAYGISDEIIHRLTRTPGLRVVSAALHSKFASAGVDSSARLEGLGVQIVIDGTVRREQNRLRVAARISTVKGLLLWSERFDSLIEGEEYLNLQQSVASALLSRVAPRVTAVRNYSGTANQSLFSLFGEVLATEALLDDGTVQSITFALRAFEMLAAKAPSYPRTYCGIAQSCIGLAQRGAVRPAELIRRAKNAAQTAVSLDPEMEEAHAVLGMALVQEWKWKAAEEAFQTALNIGDYHAAHRQYAMFLLVRQRFSEALNHLQTSQELDPFSATQKIAYGLFLYHSRWQNEAREYYAKAQQYGPLPFAAMLLRAFVELQGEDTKSAIEIVEGLGKQVGSAPIYLSAAAEIFALCGKLERAQAIVQDSNLLADSQPMSFYRKARLALALGQRPLAIGLLIRSLDTKEPELPWLASDPRFDGIRNEPAYASIVEAVEMD